LAEVARRHKATPAQVALAWLMRQDGVIVIPKATALAHVEEDIGALDLTLTPEDLATLDRAFPAPKKATSLDML
jgi:diketogulonate reductase-like aldo/keto reductase